MVVSGTVTRTGRMRLKWSKVSDRSPRRIFGCCSDCFEGLSGKSISFIACGGFHTAAITDRGALYTWGGGYFGQLGQGDEADKKMPRRCALSPAIAHRNNNNNHHNHHSNQCGVDACSV